MTESSSIIDASKFRVQLLNEENYYIWYNKLEVILRGKGLWEIVNGTELAPATKSMSKSSTTTATVNLKKFQQRKDTALTNILITIQDSCLSHVIGDREPKVIWDKLKSMYKSTSEANVDAHLSRYQAINMEPSESVMEYVSKLRELENKLPEIGSPVDDKDKRRALLRGVREEFSVTAEVIRATDKYITESISLLLVQEATVEKGETKIENNDSALMINKKERRCYYCNKKDILNTNVTTIRKA